MALDAGATALIVLAALAGAVLTATAVGLACTYARARARLRRAGGYRPLEGGARAALQPPPPPLLALVGAGVVGGLFPAPPPGALPWGVQRPQPPSPPRGGAEGAPEGAPPLRYVDLRHALCAPYGGPHLYLVFRADRGSAALVAAAGAVSAGVSPLTRDDWLGSLSAVLGWRPRALGARGAFRAEWFADADSPAPLFVSAEDGLPEALLAAVARVLPGVSVRIGREPAAP